MLKLQLGWTPQVQDTYQSLDELSLDECSMQTQCSSRIALSSFANVYDDYPPPSFDLGIDLRTEEEKQQMMRNSV